MSLLIYAPEIRPAWTQCLTNSIGVLLERVRPEGLSICVGLPPGVSDQPIRELGKALDGRAQMHLRPLEPGQSRSAWNNARLAERPESIFLVCSPGAIPSPGGLADLVLALDDKKVAMTEARRLPFERIKLYQPDTGSTSFVRKGCLAGRRAALLSVGGWDAGYFPEAGADFDLSCRLRAKGWKLRYVPWATFVDDPIAGIGPEDSLAYLLLACRLGGVALATALKTAWKTRGGPSHAEAAREFDRRQAAGHLPDPISGSGFDFIAELFALPIEEWIGAEHPEWYSPTPTDPSSKRPSDLPPTFTVVVRTQGRRLQALEDNLLSLAAQTDDDFEVILAAHDPPEEGRAVKALLETFPADFAARVRYLPVSGGGRAAPLNAALDQARGSHICFLDDDDVALPTWIASFNAVRLKHGGMAWTRVVGQPVETVDCDGREIWRATEPPTPLPEHFDPLAHLVENQTPNCAVAVPLDAFADNHLRFRDDIAVYEEWAVLLELIQRVPVHETGRVTVLFRRGTPDSSSSTHTQADWDAARDQVLAQLEGDGFFLRGEHVAELRRRLEG